jgi:hypothetical protein
MANSIANRARASAGKPSRGDSVVRVLSSVSIEGRITQTTCPRLATGLIFASLLGMAEQPRQFTEENHRGFTHLAWSRTGQREPHQDNADKRGDSRARLPVASGWKATRPRPLFLGVGRARTVSRGVTGDAPVGETHHVSGFHCNGQSNLQPSRLLVHGCRQRREGRARWPRVLQRSMRQRHRLRPSGLQLCRATAQLVPNVEPGGQPPRCGHEALSP